MSEQNETVVREDNRTDTEQEAETSVDTTPRAKTELETKITVPPQSSVLDLALENIPEVSSPTTAPSLKALDTSVGYNLLFRQNHGKPPNWYLPDFEER